MAACRFRAGAASVSFTPPAAGKLANDPADCAAPPTYDGRRDFAFEEPYEDQQGSGHYDPGDPYMDCNGNGRWDGNLLGGGAGSPRFYDHVADQVGARAMVVSNGQRRVAVEVLDNEGAFNVYLQRIRQQVAADGVHLDGIYISSNHDESAPDTIGISGVNQFTSSVNAYFADYMVRRSAQAIEQAARNMQPAKLRFAEPQEPANLRQCWSSYPYVDDQLMPTVQALDRGGRAIATLSNVSQHAESLGFNPSEPQRRWVSADWVHFFRQRIEQRFGGVAIEMAGSVGSVETPEVFPGAISRIPQRHIDESHPAGCRTLFDPNGTPAVTGYHLETTALGNTLANAVNDALIRNAQESRSTNIWGARRDICIPLTNQFFAIGANIGVFAERPGYGSNCTVKFPVAANGSTSGDELKSQVAAFRIGDGSFISVPGEVFPFTYLRGFLGPNDMPHSQYKLPPWPLPHMTTRYRFIDGLGEDMVGYIFPRGNGVGVPGRERQLARSGRHRPLRVRTLRRLGGGQLADGQHRGSGDHRAARLARPRRRGWSRAGTSSRTATRSRDPLGGPEIKCDVDTTFHFAGRAVGVWQPGQGVVHPQAWMSLDGRRQARPDRNTRGYFTPGGRRVWVDVFAPLSGGG